MMAGASLISLAGCVTVPQSDMAEDIRNSLQSGVDAFFAELEKATAGQGALVEIGTTTPITEEFAFPDPPDDWFGPPPAKPAEPAFPRPASSPPAEPGANAPPEEWAEWAAAAAAWEAEAAAWAEWEAAAASWEAEIAALEAALEAELAAMHAAMHVAHSYTNYGGWGFRATLDGKMLFEAVLQGDSAREGPHPICSGTWFGIAECVGDGWFHDLDAAVTGTPTGTNPTIGGSVWKGAARGAMENGRPVSGDATLVADLDASLIDAYLELESGNLVWQDLIMENGAFARIDEAGSYDSLGVSITGAFYGPEHEGAAGEFRHDRTMGVFGALRE